VLLWMVAFAKEGAQSTNIPESINETPQSRVKRSGDAFVHQQRRQAILEEFPQIQKLVGHDSRTQYFAYVLILVQASIAFFVSESFFFAILLGVIISPYIDFAALSLIHELSHSLVFAAPRYNRLLGIVTNIILVAPVSEAFRQHHSMHHKHLGDIEKDVDVPGKKEIQVVGNSALLKMLWLTLSVFVLPIRSVAKVPLKWDRYMVLNWIVCIIFTFSTIYLSVPAFVYLLLGVALSQSSHPANARQVQRHIKLYSKGKNESDPNLPLHKRGLNTFSYYGGLNFMTLNVGFHVEHHDFGNIAWTRLPTLRKIAGEKWYPDRAAYHSRGLSDIISFIKNPNITLADYAGKVGTSGY